MEFIMKGLGNLINNLTLTNEIFKEFGSLKTDQERVHFTYKYLQKHSLFIVNAISFKCNDKATELRNAGNEEYKKQRYWQALELFTKSASHAETDSVELALAYGNRASSLLQLGYAQHALKDVKRALDIKAIHLDYREKLLKREEACKKSSNSCKEFIPFGKLPELYGGPNPKLPSASKYVSVEYSADMGRQLVVNKDIHTGQVLLIEKPYSSILDENYYNTHCSYCFTRWLNLIPCPNCNAAMFCDEQCYDKAMVQSHKIECSVIPYLINLGLLNSKLWVIPLSLRILLTASKQGQNLRKLEDIDVNLKNEIYQSDDYINIHNLLRHSELRALKQVSNFFDHSVLIAFTLHLLNKFTNFFQNFNDNKMHYMVLAGGLMLRYLQCCGINGHQIGEFQRIGMCNIGGGIYSTLSLLNHSCDPNIVRISYQNTVVVKAVRPIKKGQQIFDCYSQWYTIHGLQQRQDHLWNQYYFKCKCNACLHDYPLLAQMNGDKMQFKHKPTVNDIIYFGNLLKKFKINLSNANDTRYCEEITGFFCEFRNASDKSIVYPWKNSAICEEMLGNRWSSYGNSFFHK